MVSLGHGTLSFKGSVPKRSQSSLADYGRNAHKKKLEYQHEKKRWEVKIKLSQYNPRKPDLAIIEVSTLNQRNNFRKPRDKSKFICYTCDERGHFARDCHRNKIISHKKKGNKRRHHAHAANDDEPSTNRIREESDDSSSD